MTFAGFTFCLIIWFKIVQVMRGGRMVKISIHDIVVGDVVPLRIGDQVRCKICLFLFCIWKVAEEPVKFTPSWYVQVPADGILISGHSLAIDESSMTGESKIVSLYALMEFFYHMGSIFWILCFCRFTRIRKSLSWCLVAKLLMVLVLCW